MNLRGLIIYVTVASHSFLNMCYCCPLDLSMTQSRSLKKTGPFLKNERKMQLCFKTFIPFHNCKFKFRSDHLLNRERFRTCAAMDAPKDAKVLSLHIVLKLSKKIWNIPSRRYGSLNRQMKAEITCNWLV